MGSLKYLLHEGVEEVMAFPSTEVIVMKNTVQNLPVLDPFNSNLPYKIVTSASQSFSVPSSTTPGVDALRALVPVIGDYWYNNMSPPPFIIPNSKTQITPVMIAAIMSLESSGVPRSNTFVSSKTSLPPARGLFNFIQDTQEAIGILDPYNYSAAVRGACDFFNSNASYISNNNQGVVGDTFVCLLVASVNQGPGITLKRYHDASVKDANGTTGPKYATIVKERMNMLIPGSATFTVIN